MYMYMYNVALNENKIAFFLISILKLDNYIFIKRQAMAALQAAVTLHSLSVYSLILHNTDLFTEVQLVISISIPFIDTTHACIHSHKNYVAIMT